MIQNVECKPQAGLLSLSVQALSLPPRPGDLTDPRNRTQGWLEVTVLSVAEKGVGGEKRRGDSSSEALAADLGIGGSYYLCEVR